MDAPAAAVLVPFGPLAGMPRRPNLSRTFRRHTQGSR